jgi:hypothetical protein
VSCLKKDLCCLKTEPPKILLLKEHIAALYSYKKEKNFNQNENYLVISFYQDLMDFSIISIDDKLNPTIKNYFYDENYNNINFINTLKSYDNELNKDDIDNAEFFLTCNKYLEKVKLDKSEINKIIIIISTNYDKLFKKIFSCYFKVDVIVLQNDFVFVDGAARYAKYIENNEDNLEKLKDKNIKLKLNKELYERLINKKKSKFKKLLIESDNKKINLKDSKDLGEINKVKNLKEKQEKKEFKRNK